MEQTPIRVIIISWNRPIYLWTCLDSLYRYTRYPAEFVLVDNGSTDPQVRRVIEAFDRRGMFFHVELARTNSPQRMKEAKHTYVDMSREYFATVESDTAVFDTQPCWLERMRMLMDSDPELSLLGSFIDKRDFVDLAKARRLAPDLDTRQLEGLIKANSPERSLEPNNEPVIDPFNPPGRLLMYRTKILNQIQPGTDDFLYRQVKGLGLKAGIATDVLHRHLSLLNVFDYPEYSMADRDRFFKNVRRPWFSWTRFWGR